MLGCSRQTVKLTSNSEIQGQSNVKYDYLLAEGLRQKYVGDINQAIEIFENCIELDGKRSVPYFELAQIFSGTGEGEKAVKYASIAANLDKENFWYQLACGSLFIQNNNNDSAIVYFEQALKDNPRTIETYKILAGLYSEKEEKEKADSLFMVLDNAGELDEQMFLVMISGLVNEGNYDEAAKRTIALINRGPSEARSKALLADIYYEAGEKEKSDSIYSEIIESDPENAESQLLMLVNMMNKKEYAGASGFLTSILKSEAIDRDRKVAIVKELAQDSGYIADQADFLEKSLVSLEMQYPGDEEILSIRPLIYEEQGRYKEATERIEEILKSVKPGYFFKERLILLYARQEEYDKLFRLASVYANENNMSILGKIYYSIAAMELKKYDVADNELNKALILAGNDNQMKVQVLSMLGDLKYRMKEFKEAYKYLDEALTINPDDVMILNNYSYFLSENNNDLERALSMAEKVMQKEGSNPTYMDTYAWALYKLGKYGEALEVMNKIISGKEENDPEILEHMGYILKSLSRCTEAISYWERALDSDKTKVYLSDEIEKCQREANK